MNKIVVFQGLRAYAFLLIFISHCNYILNDDGRNVFSYAGALGVSIFIMLSGFLAVSKNINTGNNPSCKWNYIQRNFLRKLKKFYVLHLFTLLLSLPFVFKALTGLNWWKHCAALCVNFFLMQSWIPVSGVYFSYNAVTWYLSVAMFLVLIEPYVCRFLCDIDKKLLFVLLVVLFVCEALITVVFADTKISHWITYIFPLTRTFDYVIGGVTALLIRDKYCNGIVSRNSTSLLVASMALQIGLLYKTMVGDNALFLIVAWVWPVVIMLMVLLTNASVLSNTIFENKYMVILGDISFELFMFHQLIIRYATVFANKLGVVNSIWTYIISLVFSVILSIMWRKFRTNYYVKT